MSLPEELSQRFWDRLISYEEEYKMQYVTSVEKIGIKKGIQIGLKQGLLAAIKMGLELKFGSNGLKLYPKIKKIEDVDVLETISDVIRSAQNLSEIDRFL